MKKSQRVFSLLLCFVVVLSTISAPSVAHAGSSSDFPFHEVGVWGKLVHFFGGTTGYDAIMGTNYSGNYAANKPPNYYTTPTSSVVDKSGNVTDYYRGGDTTNTSIIDNYNKSLSANKQIRYNVQQRRWKNGEKELQVMDNIRYVLGGRKG